MRKLLVGNIEEIEALTRASLENAYHAGIKSTRLGLDFELSSHGWRQQLKNLGLLTVLLSDIKSCLFTKSAEVKIGKYRESKEENLKVLIVKGVVDNKPYQVVFYIYLSHKGLPLRVEICYEKSQWKADKGEKFIIDFYAYSKKLRSEMRIKVMEVYNKVMIANKNKDN